MQCTFRYVTAALAAMLVNVLAIDVAEVSHVTPVQKVITMLTGMLEKGKSERHTEQVQFATYKQFCEDTEATVTQQIKQADEQITMLQADIQKYKTSNEDLAREVQDLEADYATYSGDEKAATKVREMQRAEYEKVHKDYTESIDAIGKAIQVLKQRAVNKAQAAQEAPKENVVALLSLEKIPEASKRAVEAFLARGEESPEAYGYEFQSHSIIDMLEKLRDKFTEERSQLEKDELNERHSYDLLTADLKDSMANAERAISTKTQQKSKDQQLVASRQGDLQDTTSTRADDSKYLSDLTSTCTQKSNDFESRQKLRGDEIVAIEKAIEILSSDDVMGAADKHLPKGALLQVSPSLAQLRSSHEKSVSNQMRMAAYLNDQAARIGSRVLSAIAIRARDDPFAKVKKMIRDLISRLEEQAGEEAQHKGWCDTELKENEQVRTTRTASVDSLTNEIDELTASISKEATLITELSLQVAELDGNVAKATEIRQKDKAENEATIQDAKDAQTAVSRAILVLKEFYATAAESTAFMQKKRSVQNPEAPEVFDAPYTGMATENGGVIGMLEVIQSDFARLQSDAESAEESQAEAHSKFMSESAVTKAQKESDITHKTSQKQNQEQQLTDKKNDLISEEKELDAANKYFDKLKPSCLDAGMSFQEREQRRQEEIQSLQEALRILNGEDIASMMQMN